MATVFGHRCDLVLSWARKAGMTLMIDKIGSGFMGSGVFAKAFTLEHAYAARDTEGKSVKEELERIDYLGPKEPGAHPIGTCFKTHIEQGPVLEDNDATIGVVIGVLGIKWCDRTVTGMEAHAGPTPMALRKDALQVATKLMQEVVAIALQDAPHGRSTVGMVQVHPNSRNVSPGRVKFSIDLRNASDELSTRWTSICGQRSARQAKKVACQLPSKSYRIIQRNPFTLTALKRSRARQKTLGYSNMPVVSDAGQDAVYMARLAPAEMIFIPCKNGISHNEIEDAKPGRITAGGNVLLHAMLERTGVD